MKGLLLLLLLLSELLLELLILNLKPLHNLLTSVKLLTHLFDFFLKDAYLELMLSY